MLTKHGLAAAVAMVVVAGSVGTLAWGQSDHIGGGKCKTIDPCVHCTIYYSATYHLCWGQKCTSPWGDELLVCEHSSTMGALCLVSGDTFEITCGGCQRWYCAEVGASCSCDCTGNGDTVGYILRRGGCIP